MKKCYRKFLFSGDRQGSFRRGAPGAEGGHRSRLRHEDPQEGRHGGEGTGNQASKTLIRLLTLTYWNFEQCFCFTLPIIIILNLWQCSYSGKTCTYL